MFYIHSMSGSPGPYVSGAIRARRSIDALRPVEPVPGVGVASTPSQSPRARSTDAYQPSTREQSQRRRLLYARDLMAAPVSTLTPDATVHEAWRLITAKRFRHVPIVNGEQVLVGILSDRDLLRALASRERETITQWEAVRVASIMHTDVLSATPDTEIREVARVLFEERIGCMPIVDSAARVVGLVTRSDVLRALLVHAPLELWS